MKNKKLLLILFTLLFININNIFSYTLARLYDRDSYVVTAINHLALISQITPIYDSFPTTEANVLNTFNKIDISHLTKDELILYEKIRDELNKEKNVINDVDDFSLNVELPITFEGYFYKTNNNSKLKYYELDTQYKDVSPWFDLRSQFYFGDNIYGYSQFAVKDKLEYALTDEYPFLYSNLNSFILSDDFQNNFQIYQPYKVGLSVGNFHYNFQIGRNRLSTGEGVSGTFFIGDNFTKQEYFSINLFSNCVSYTINVSEFDQQESSLNFSNISFDGEQQYRVMHKVKVNILENLSLDIYQGAIFEIDNFNYRMIIPFMYIHNYFDFSDNKILDGNDEANNILGFQTKWVLNDSNEINLILSFDQIQLMESAEVFPSAYGVLLNYKTTESYKSGFINRIFEVVYTSPYLYLNEKYDDQGINYNYDYIVGNNYGEYDEIGYSGYYYGPDTFLVDYDFKYYNIEDWSLGYLLSFRLHGTKSIATNENLENSDIIDEVISSFIVGTPEIIIKVKPNFSLDINNKINISGFIGFNSIINHYNDVDNSPYFFTEGTISTKINIF